MIRQDPVLQIMHDLEAQIAKKQSMIDDMTTYQDPETSFYQMTLMEEVSEHKTLIRSLLERQLRKDYETVLTSLTFHVIYDRTKEAAEATLELQRLAKKLEEFK